MQCELHKQLRYDERLLTSAVWTTYCRKYESHTRWSWIHTVGMKFIPLFLCVCLCVHVCMFVCACVCMKDQIVCQSMLGNSIKLHSPSQKLREGLADVIIDIFKNCFAYTYYSRTKSFLCPWVRVQYILLLVQLGGYCNVTFWKTSAVNWTVPSIPMPWCKSELNSSINSNALV